MSASSASTYSRIKRAIGAILDAARLGGGEIVLASITAIGGDLPRRRAAAGDLALEHWQEALGIVKIASLDDDIEDQAAVAGGQVELVSILHVTGTFDDDVGMRLEQTYQLLAGRHRLTVKDAPLALGEDALNQRQKVAELSAPALSRGASRSPASCSAAWVARVAAISSR
jgi:hypothetical protein